MKQAEAEKTLSRSQQRRRDDIIQAALKVFEEQGFEAAKMADIAKEADVAKGTLYLYFDNKASLMQGVIETSIVPSLRRIGEAADAHDGSAGELLKNQIRIAAQRMASQEMKMLLRHMISNGSQSPKIVSAYYENVLKKGMELFGQTVKRGVETGEFRKEVAGVDPLVLVGSPVYLAVWKILFEDISPIDVDALVDDHLEVVLNGLSNPK
ncbi:MAG: TetR/AcrR family transcriptional regulator [Pseudomonadota bacterium]